MNLCSGFGQYHSINNSENPQPYAALTLADIGQLAADPQQVLKKKAQWVIFSSLMSRVYSEQRASGRFYALWADIDKQPDPLTFDTIVSRTCGVVPGANFIAYTSSGATKDNQKCRLIFPLAEPVDGATYLILQKILNDKLEAAGIIPDRKTEGAGQICYLPNRGEYYRYHFEQFMGPLDPNLWADEIEEERQRIKDAEKTAQERTERARLKAAMRMKDGTESPIEAFNAEYPIELMFDRYGYLKKGERYLSPGSESGNPGVTLTPDGRKWLSKHGSDADIGMATSDSTMGDAFDLFCYYEHGNDHDAALRAAGEMFETTAGLSEAAQPADDLSFFIMNGEAKTMEAKMLDDKFVLGKMAIWGQSTIFYAAPNVGKTLLVLWLLIKAIESGEIDGNDVFYINADDTHKGFVHKLKLAELHDFFMLAPGYKNFKADDLPKYLNQWIVTGKSNGKILILDTVKKFTDLMKKDRASKFAETIRQFVMNNGTVIMLAHVNKHKSDDGKVIYSGTSDMVDDCDCAYTIEKMTEDIVQGNWQDFSSDKVIRTIKFENFKARGDVAHEAVYRYDASEYASYSDRLESVEEVTKEQRRAVEKKKQLDEKLERNQLAVDAIKDCIREGINQKTALITEAHERSGLPKAKITKALADHTGKDVDQHQFWHVNREDNNAHIYQLNYTIAEK